MLDIPDPGVRLQQAGKSVVVLVTVCCVGQYSQRNHANSSQGRFGVLAWWVPLQKRMGMANCLLDSFAKLMLAGLNEPNRF